MKAMCTRCGGDGQTYVPKAADYDGQMGTAMVQQRCRECDGSGWLPFPGTQLSN